MISIHKGGVYSGAVVLENGNNDIGWVGTTMIYNGGFLVSVGHKTINPQEIGSEVENIDLADCEIIQIFHNMESLEAMANVYINLRDRAKEILKELEEE